MDPSLIYISLILVGICVTINIKITLNLHQKLKHLYQSNQAFLPVEIGNEVPLIKFKRIVRLDEPSSKNSHQPKAIVFMSPHCSVCKEKILEIEAIIPKLSIAGLSLELITNEPKRQMLKFLSKSPLLNYVLLTNTKNFRKLNPSHSYPFYLFVDHLGQLQAGGTIGDEDWQSFLKQMNEIKA